VWWEVQESSPSISREWGDKWNWSPRKVQLLALNSEFFLPKDKMDSYLIFPFPKFYLIFPKCIFEFSNSATTC
jgi:hypothetical protein